MNAHTRPAPGLIDWPAEREKAAVEAAVSENPAHYRTLAALQASVALLSLERTLKRVLEDAR